MVKLTEEQRAELEALEAMPDDQIDYSDIPEMTEAEWSKADGECSTSPTCRT